MKSPAKVLFRTAPKSLVNLSAEAKTFLQNAGLRLTLKYVESNDFRCDVEVSTGLITISTRAMEVIWVLSYLNGLFYDRVFKAGLTKPVQLDPANDPELLNALKLVGWILNAWSDPESPQEWPADLPKPCSNPSKKSLEALADGLTLSTLGFLLLHEIAHAELKHHPTTKTEWSIDQEKDADREASELYLDGTDDPVRTYRLVGMANALLTQVIQSLFTREFGGQSHPEKWNRLFNVVVGAESDPDHPVFAFLAQLTHLYTHLSGRVTDQQKLKDFLAGFNQFTEKLSLESARQKEEEERNKKRK